MAKLNETPGWVDVTQLETTDRVQGGPGGKSNVQAQELANRTAWLRGLLDDLSESLEMNNDLHLSDYAALRAYSGGRTRVYISGPLVTSYQSEISGTFTLNSSDESSADNGGVVIVDGIGRRWHRKFSGPISAGWWFTNSSDRTESLQAALNYWKSNDCDMVIPPGTHDITAQLLVNFTSYTYKNNKRLSGYGAVLNGVSISGDVFKLSVTGATTLVRRVIIEGMTIAANDSAGYALTLQGPLAGD